MKNDQKLKLADIVLQFLKDNEEGSIELPKHIGILNKAIGINGFKKAEIGTPVFEIGDRYFIMLESLDGKTNVEVKYYKDTLKPAINFGPM